MKKGEEPQLQRLDNKNLKTQYLQQVRLLV